MDSQSDINWKWLGIFAVFLGIVGTAQSRSARSVICNLFSPLLAGQHSGAIDTLSLRDITWPQMIFGAIVIGVTMAVIEYYFGGWWLGRR